jgi:tripartite-type tricarboxylate transporter receptor subunit TctC
VPTPWEAGYGEAYVPGWCSIRAPAGTPAAILAKLNAQMVEIAGSPEMMAILVQSPEAMGRHLVEHTRRTAELIRLTQLKLG